MTAPFKQFKYMIGNELIFGKADRFLISVEFSANAHVLLIPAEPEFFGAAFDFFMVGKRAVDEIAEKFIARPSAELFDGIFFQQFKGNDVACSIVKIMPLSAVCTSSGITR